MTSKFLPVFINNALEDNEELLPAFTSGSLGLRDVLRFCQGFRIAGIGSLLLTGTATHFHAYLHKSARAFVHYLRQVGTKGWLASKADPFFDAVACGDLEAARELARLAPTTVDRKGEYEEDFLYARFLMDQFLPDGGGRDWGALLQGYERVLEGSSDPRLEVCRALLAGDAEGLDAGLTQMMAERDARYLKLAEKEVLSEEVLATERYLSIEGLVLVRLATSKGMGLSEEHLLIPSVAREGALPSYRSDSWKDVFP